MANSSSSISDIMHENLQHIFGEHSSSKRIERMSKLYHPDIVFYEPNAKFQGPNAIEERIAELLKPVPDWEFRVEGPVKENHELGVANWTFGPKGGEPVVQGTDIVIVKDGKIQTLWVLLHKEGKVL